MFAMPWPDARNTPPDADAQTSDADDAEERLGRLPPAGPLCWDCLAGELGIAPRRWKRLSRTFGVVSQWHRRWLPASNARNALLYRVR